MSTVCSIRGDWAITTTDFSRGNVLSPTAGAPYCPAGRTCPLPPMYRVCVAFIGALAMQCQHLRFIISPTDSLTVYGSPPSYVLSWETNSLLLLLLCLPRARRGTVWRQYFSYAEAVAASGSPPETTGGWSQAMDFAPVPLAYWNCQVCK